MRTNRLLTNSFAAAWLLLAAASSGCSVYDSREDCPQGIHVEAYSRTDCDVDTLYPAAVSGLNFYLFDEQNRLVSTTHRPTTEATRTAFTHTLDARNGLYTVVVCSDIDERLFETPTHGKAGISKQDLMLKLRHPEEGMATALDGTRIYYGESAAVHLPDPAEYGSVFRTAHVNLQEQTNRITVTVQGLARAEGYEVAIQTAGGAMNYEGRVREIEPVEYPATASVERGVLTSSFTTLALTTGFQTVLVIRDRLTRTELYRGDLLGTLLLKNPEVNLACDHDFRIDFTAADRCSCGTYTLMEIRVNDWLVHSYDADF
jgi:hypothetical protein